MAARLPSTMTELHDSIVAGDIDTNLSLKLQRKAVEQDKWSCVVDIFSIDKNIPDGDLPLKGIGLAHKDIFVLPGHSPGCGAAIAPYFKAANNPAIDRLSAFGAQTLASLSLAEFACGVTGQNDHYPLPTNPQYPDYMVGGSSSGSAVAVAGCLCYGSLGTDTAGSVRIPAATCGVIGFKPTNGLLETTGCYPLAPSLDTIGVLARSVLDVAILFYFAAEARVAERVLPRLSEKFRSTKTWSDSEFWPLQNQWRVAVCHEHVHGRYSASESLQNQINTALGTTTYTFSKLDGIKDFSHIIKNATTVLHVEAAATHYNRLQGYDSPQLSEISRATTLPGVAIPAVWYQLALRERFLLRDTFVERYLSSNDIMVTPILPYGLVPWSHVHTQSNTFNPYALLALFSWTAFVNYLGLPAVVLPIGVDDKGLPVCLQAIARPEEDEKLLSFAYQVEQECSRRDKNYE